MSNDVKHDVENEKFYLVEDGFESYLEYRKVGEYVLNLVHTYTPIELRGRGIAGKIVSYALDYARENGFKIIPGCSYVRAFIQRHTEYEDLVSE